MVIVSSMVGSIGDNNHKQRRFFAYRASKAALNMVAKNLSIELDPSGILVVAMHPGWVQTDMGGK